MAKHIVLLAGSEVGMHIRTVSVPTRERLEVWQRCLEPLVGEKLSGRPGLSVGDIRGFSEGRRERQVRTGGWLWDQDSNLD
jgi:hypothetical protein